MNFENHFQSFTSIPLEVREYFDFIAMLNKLVEEDRVNLPQLLGSKYAPYDIKAILECRVILDAVTYIRLLNELETLSQ